MKNIVLNKIIGRNIKNENERLIRILLKESRTPEEGQYVYEYLSKLKFFQNFQENFFGDTDSEALENVLIGFKFLKCKLNLFKRVCYEHHSKGEVIFYENDKSNEKYYIILSGEVGFCQKEDKSVFARKQSVNSPKFVETNSNIRGRGSTWSVDQAKPFHKRISMGADNSPVRKRTSGIDNSPVKLNDVSPFEFYLLDPFLGDIIRGLGTLRNAMKRGDGFGEKALIELDGIRTASVVALRDVEFIIIKRKDFILIEDKYNKARVQKGEFLMSFVPALKSINSQNIIDLLVYSIHEKSFSKGANIISQGEKGQIIYWIEKGELRLEREIIFLYKESQTDARESAKKMLMNICCISHGAVFGEELLLEKNKEKEYYFNARVMSPNAKVYFISKSVLEMKFPEDTVRELVKSFNLKEETRFQHLKSIFQNISGDAKILMSKFVSETQTQEDVDYIKEIFDHQRPTEETNIYKTSPKKTKLTAFGSPLRAKRPNHSSKHQQINQGESFQEFYKEFILQRDLSSINPQTPVNEAPLNANSSMGQSFLKNKTMKRSLSDTSLLQAGGAQLEKKSEAQGRIGENILREIFDIKDKEYDSTKGNVYTSQNVDLFCRLGREHTKNTKETRNNKKFHKSNQKSLVQVNIRHFSKENDRKSSESPCSRDLPLRLKNTSLTAANYYTYLTSKDMTQTVSQFYNKNNIDPRKFVVPIDIKDPNFFTKLRFDFGSNDNVVTTHSRALLIKKGLVEQKPIKVPLVKKMAYQRLQESLTYNSQDAKLTAVSPISRGLIPSASRAANNFFDKPPPVYDSSLLTAHPYSGSGDKATSFELSSKKRSLSSSLSRIPNINQMNEFQHHLREKALYKLKITKIAKMPTNNEKYSLVNIVAEGRPKVLH